ncbi:sulfurtransferase complex subunit TusB [Neptuniibacter halophilus]|uniref:sulfurtransferase complex subunit TusB n=1 Tax=Neptuniibacter halophilus TaxID=651666 RepID=UPI0025724288|nr:sulfurtransferase complex subunit TusB [Neptuniibacter halophilus]
MTLHLLNKSPENQPLIQRMLQSMAQGDALLLIEDGVYNALPAYQPAFNNLPENVSLFALEADYQARGLTGQISAQFTPANDRMFVRLSCEHSKVVSWF